MATQNFQVGDIVVLRSNLGLHDDSAYEIMRIMPADSPDTRYRLRGVSSPRERVAQGYELRSAASGSIPTADESPFKQARRRPGSGR